MPRRSRSATLQKIRELALAERISVTNKAWREISTIQDRFHAEIDFDDVRDLLLALRTRHYHSKVWSEHRGEWIHVFKPPFQQLTLYLKVAVRDDCVVISFHEDQ